LYKNQEEKEVIMKNAIKILPVLLTTTALLLLTASILYGQEIREQESSGQQPAGALFEKALFTEEVKGNLPEAIELYGEVLDASPDNRQLAAQALLHMGFCYEKLGSEQARKLYSQVISKYSEQEEEVAVASERMKSLNAYVAELDRKAEQHMKKGNELFKLWEYESAIREYENAIRLRPNTLLAMNAQYCIGHSWYRAGKYEEALATFTELMEENPRSTIAPVTELMLSQVEYAMENDKDQGLATKSPDGNTIIDPGTGIQYTKIKSFSGRNDVIAWTTGGFNLSPDGRFMVQDNMIVPTDGSDYFEFIDMKASRATYSPDMQKAAFYADSAIWVVPVSPETGRASGAPVKLLDGKYRWQSPVSWSPDGEKIAFQRIDNQYAGSIWTLAVKDGSLSQVTEESDGYNRGATWSPDGKTFAYWKNKAIWLSTLDGGKAKKILDPGGVPHLFSPDGEWLYYSNWDTGKGLFCLSDNRNIKLVTPVEVGNFIAFTPDSERIVFFRPSYHNKWGLKIASPSGGPSYEPAGDIDIYGAEWSPDSKVILSKGENITGLEGDIVYWIIHLEKGESHQLDFDVNVNGELLPFGVSPDQKHLAFSVAREDGNKDLYIVPISVEEARTTGPARLIFEGSTVGAFNVDFSWSEDGSKIALIHNNEIWIIPVSGDNPEQITDNREGKSWIRWSPNGEMLSFYTDYTGDRTKRTLNIIPASGGNSIKVFENCVTSAWSPDSKTLSVYAGGKIYVMSIDGSNINQVFDQSDHGLIDLSSAQWSPDGKKLAFLGSDKETEETHLFMIPSDGGKIKMLAPEDNSYKYSLRWSPDGKWLSYLTEESVKVRPEGTMWEADFEEVIDKLAAGNQ